MNLFFLADYCGFRFCFGCYFTFTYFFVCAWAFLTSEFVLNGTISHILESERGPGRVEKRNDVNIFL